jgi:hypothetical protein
MRLLLLMWIMNPANAAEFRLSPGESIQNAMNAAVGGDVIVLESGTWEEDLSTEVDGAEDNPITVRAAEDATVVITASGEVIQIDHAHWTFANIIFDGQYGLANTIDIGDGAHHLTMSQVEVRHSGRDCIDMGAPSSVLIEESQIHHCLGWNSDDDEAIDAHAISGGAVQNLVIRNTSIHTFSGDGVHFDASRRAPGWNNITIEDCEIWLEPLDEATNGFPAGSVPGRNGVTTKTYPDGERAILTIQDTTVYGFKEGIDGGTQAAFLLKENIDATLRRIHVHDSAIGFRIRGATDARPTEPWVQIENALIYDVSTGIRYEDEIRNLNIIHTTFGQSIDNIFTSLDAEGAEVNVRNSLFMTDELPTQTGSGMANQIATTDDFIDADGGDYHLLDTSEAIDAGIEVTGIDTDLDGRERVVGAGPDLGPYEYGAEVWDTGMSDDTGIGADTADPDEDDPVGTTGDDTGTSEAKPPGVPGDGSSNLAGEKGGCGCATSNQPAGDVVLMLLALLCIRRERISEHCRSIHISFE